MTNYNERLDEALAVFANYDDSYEPGYEEGVIKRITEAKQALTSLIKELVEEAKPGTWVDPEDTDDLEWQGYADGVNDFEQNLLKALEEV